MLISSLPPCSGCLKGRISPSEYTRVRKLASFAAIQNLR
jgi:hypothetical protein